MNNQNIIKTLKSDIKELKGLGYKYNFTKCFIYNKYCIFLNAFITGNDSCFNKVFREVQFKGVVNANKLIQLLNNDLNIKMRCFE